MKPEKWSVADLFKSRRQFLVPFYQRGYVWTLSHQWANLWLDIAEKAESRLLEGGDIKPHFLGAVVLEKQPQNVTTLEMFDTLHVIDGQQRLTTLQYLIKALSLALEGLGSTQLNAHLKRVLINDEAELLPSPRIDVHKVVPTFRDVDTYLAVMTAAKLADLRLRFPASFAGAGHLRKIGISHPPALEAVWFFHEKIEEWVGKVGDAQLARAQALVGAVLNDLRVVAILLDPKEDDAQLIFETLNGRGEPLQAIDLIRNFIFMQAAREEPDPKELYEGHWKQFEATKWLSMEARGRMKRPRLEWMIHSALQAQGREIELQSLYKEYRDVVAPSSGTMSAAQQLDLLSTAGRHYLHMVEGEGTSPIARFGQRIARLDFTTVYPLALQIAASEADDEDKRQMYDVLVSYFMRRAVVGLTTKNYNNVFLQLAKHMAENGITPATLRASLTKMKGENSRWPTDGEFRVALEQGRLFDGSVPIQGRIRTLLSELEIQLRHTSKTEEQPFSQLPNLDIEHVMPIAWMHHWPLTDGSTATFNEKTSAVLARLEQRDLTHRQAEILTREDAKATLGNLTLLNLSVNREAQNFDFKRKKDLLIKHTVLRLNVPLIEGTEWTVKSIQGRGKMLASTALLIYPGPDAQ